MEALQSGPVETAFAFASVFLVLGTSLWYRRRLDRAEAGSLFGAFLSGCSIPKGIYLAFYLANPDPASVHTKLHGFEREICAAGVVVTFLAATVIWGSCETIRQQALVPARVQAA